MADRTPITAEYLRQVLDYDPATGVFTWRERPAEHFADGKYSAERVCAARNLRFAGTDAGTTDNEGYMKIGIDGLDYHAARLAWLWMTGAWPPHEIDHRDRNPSNNRFGNLRPATHAENLRNCVKKRNNTSGHKGVYWHKQHGKWHARIMRDGKCHHLGLFDEDKLNDAADAYAVAAAEHHGEFARIT